MTYTKFRFDAFGVWLLAMVLDAGTSHGAWEIKAVQLNNVPEEIILRKKGRGISKVRVRSKNGWLVIYECDLKLCWAPSRRGMKKAKPLKDALPDGKVARGRNNIRAAWLSKPTRRYQHGILGDRIEAGALSVSDGFGGKHEFTLPIDEVFEDRYARIVDLDGDGFDEIVVVRSSIKHGAALAIFQLSGQGLVEVARTPPLGRRGSWLNPAGFGDYDGDGNIEIAMVVMPDFSGQLEFWEYKKGGLTREMSLRGFSNHVTGSRVMNMSASANFDGAGKVDLALPGMGRDVMRVISLDGGMVAEPVKLKLPGRIVTEIVSVRHKGRPVIIAGLDSGMVVLISNAAVSQGDEIPSWAKKNNETSLLNDLIKRNRRRKKNEKFGQGKVR